MDITRAFSFIFDDEEWLGKVMMVLVWSLVSAIPLVGLVGTAALIGYSLVLIRHMLQGYTRVLPRWENVGDMIRHGFNVLIASLVYHIPNGLMAFGFLLLMPVSDGRQPDSSAILAVMCCLAILLIAYNLFILPLLAVGMIRYARVGQITVFFQVGDLWATVNRHLGATVQWIFFTFLAGLLLGVVGIIPLVGWLAVMALSVPVQAHLLGQYALITEALRKQKPKRPY